VAEPLQIHTERLVLRPWRREDREPFFLMGSDPAVREYFPDLVSREESDAAADRNEADFAQRGWGSWVVEIPAKALFIGFVGLLAPSEQHHFCPCIEIAWSLARPYWGRGYATEAARAALAFGFEEAGLEETVAYTAVANVRFRPRDAADRYALRRRV
jgi:RimJ/RimL family protein N-acetyltransferase